MEILSTLISGAVGGLVVHLLANPKKSVETVKRIAVPHAEGHPVVMRAFANKSGERRAPKANDDKAARLKELNP